MFMTELLGQGFGYRLGICGSSRILVDCSAVSNLPKRPADSASWERLREWRSRRWNDVAIGNNWQG
jgi:hypothetical protein